MKEPLVSVIMPCYNAGKYLQQSVDSILSQSWKDLELIIVNDGSTDDSAEILRQIRDPRVRIFENNTNQGVAVTRNTGFANSCGRYIAPFDADDIAVPVKIEKQLRFLEQNPAYGMVGSWVRKMGIHNEPLPGNWILKAKPADIPSLLLFKNYFCQSAVMVRRTAVPQGGYDTSLPVCEDYDMWIKIAEHWKTWNLPAFLVHYRVHPESTQYANRDLFEQSEYIVHQRSFQKLGIRLDKEQWHTLRAIKYPGRIEGNPSCRQVESLLRMILESNLNGRHFPPGALAMVALNRYYRFIAKSLDIHQFAPGSFFPLSLWKHYISAWS